MGKSEHYKKREKYYKYSYSNEPPKKTKPPKVRRNAKADKHYDLTVKYDITLHAVKRYLERVLDINSQDRLDEGVVEYIMTIITDDISEGMIGVKTGVTLVVPLVHHKDFKAVISNGRVVTIKHKD